MTVNPQLKQRDMAVAFFLTYVTNVGRNLESTRGYLEFVRPVLAAESHGSALSTAVDATALKLWSILRPSNVAGPSLIQLHNQALVKLQDAVYNPTEQSKDATVFAALMLQQYDTLSAVFDRHKAHSTHRKGAMALLTQNGGAMCNSKYYGHLLGNLFHSKISYSVRHKVPLTEGEVDWLHDEVIPALPCNPSYVLDVIGVSISRLQSALTEVTPLRGEASSDKLTELMDLMENVDTQLQAWIDTVPEFWHPRRIKSESFTLQRVATYDGSCDIYPSVQIANIWNTWRTYRLILEQIKLGIAQIDQDREVSFFEAGNIISESLQTIEELAESICRCIPFYLGNCQEPVSYTDIDNSLLTLPSYHDLPPEDEGFLAYKRSDYFVSKTDHNRHVGLHGPLHALSILSSLIGLLFEGQNATLTQVALQNQKQWMNEQFHRSLYLTHFVRNHSKHDGDVLSSQNQQALPAAGLAQVTRQALRTVNIL